MTLPLEDVAWIHGEADCTHATDPLIQVHQFDDDTFILRVSKCFSYEGNFIYLLFGDARAVMFDTGGRPDPESAFAGTALPLRRTIDGIMADWRKKRGMADIDLVVAHSHSHGDHVAWDGEFDGRAHTKVVKPGLASVKFFFGLPNWPNGQTMLQLGNRGLIVFPIPGHEASHIAVYDQRNKWLFTGDTLYAGLLTIDDWDAYRASTARLAQFASQHEVACVLGTHIEMKDQPRQLYTIGTTYQPNEHPLPLAAARVQELEGACNAMGDNPHREVHDDFIIDSPH
jgi:hydroxyacylglutathione hydrolase